MNSFSITKGEIWFQVLLTMFNDILLHVIIIFLVLPAYYFLIFLTRMSKYNKDEVLEKAEKDLAAVTNQHVSRLVKELQGTDFWKLRRAYSPGVYFQLLLHFIV